MSQEGAAVGECRKTAEEADFCRAHGDLLASKVIVYKHLQHWTVSPAGFRQEDADTGELVG